MRNHVAFVTVGSALGALVSCGGTAAPADGDPAAARRSAERAAAYDRMAAAGQCIRAATAQPESEMQDALDRCKGAPKEARSPDAGPSRYGRLEPDLIQGGVRLQFPAMTACYQAGLARNPRLAGRVLVRFTIGPSGRVTFAVPYEGDPGRLDDDAVEACVVNEFKGLRFPRPDGGSVEIVYPIIFDPG